MNKVHLWCKTRCLILAFDNFVFYKNHCFPLNSAFFICNLSYQYWKRWPTCFRKFYMGGWQWFRFCESRLNMSLRKRRKYSTSSSCSKLWHCCSSKPQHHLRGQTLAKKTVRGQISQPSRIRCTYFCSLCKIFAHALSLNVIEQHRRPPISKWGNDPYTLWWNRMDLIKTLKCYCLTKYQSKEEQTS